jgi:hypothetical protein
VAFKEENFLILFFVFPDGFEMIFDLGRRLMCLPRSKMAFSSIFDLVPTLACVKIGPRPQSRAAQVNLLERQKRHKIHF